MRSDVGILRVGSVQLETVACLSASGSRSANNIVFVRNIIE